MLQQCLIYFYKQWRSMVLRCMSEVIAEVRILRYLCGSSVIEGQIGQLSCGEGQYPCVSGDITLMNYFIVPHTIHVLSGCGLKSARKSLAAGEHSSHDLSACTDWTLISPSIYGSCTSCFSTVSIKNVRISELSGTITRYRGWRMAEHH